jgi:hypothetical protein
VRVCHNLGVLLTQTRPIAPSKWVANVGAPQAAANALRSFLSRGTGRKHKDDKSKATSGASGGGKKDSKETKKLTKATGEYKGKVVLNEALKDVEVKQVDTSIARSKPKAAGGRRGPTRRKKVAIALERAEAAPGLDFDLSGAIDDDDDDGADNGGGGGDDGGVNKTAAPAPPVRAISPAPRDVAPAARKYVVHLLCDGG